MSRRDSASRIISAPLGRSFDALVDRNALEIWLPPDGMTGRFEHFDPTPGGSYRLILTYAAPAAARAKSSADVDIVEARFVDIVMNDRVVQAVDFVSDDPVYGGTMTMTWVVRTTDGGTLVEFIADDVPAGISAEDHSAGMTSSLENLARYLEPSQRQGALRPRGKPPPDVPAIRDTRHRLVDGILMRWMLRGAGRQRTSCVVTRPGGCC